jgi:5,10-methylenetetrahydromethanopterin reductase
MIKIGLGLPGRSVADVRHSAEAAAPYAFDSFSVYGDLGDLPPYAVLHANADVLQDSAVDNVGPLGVAVGMMHPEIIATNAMVLEEQLPERSSIGLVRGAFLETIGKQPARLSEMEQAITYIRQRFDDIGQETPPIYMGGFGPKALHMAGRLAVRGVKIGGSANPAMALRARELINNPDIDIVLGAVSVIDDNRRAARALARAEVAKYLDVVGGLDPTLEGDDLASLERFKELFQADDPAATGQISDSLLDKFALAGTPDDALAAIERMHASGANRFEFGTPQGLTDRPTAIRYIARTVLREIMW